MHLTHRTKGIYLNADLDTPFPLRGSPFVMFPRVKSFSSVPPCPHAPPSDLGPSDAREIPRLLSAPRGRTRALVSSLTSALPLLAYGFAPCPRASQKELLKSEAYKTAAAAACRAAVRAPAVSVAASSSKTIATEKEGNERERHHPLFRPRRDK